jgi:hypothetical protein
VIDRILQNIRNFFLRSCKVHLRQNPAEDTRQLVELFDRFLDGPMRYDLEWDDFISWENSNPHVEEVRNRLGEYEEFLFSDDRSRRMTYLEKVVEERNRLARLLGMGERERPQME